MNLVHNSDDSMIVGYKFNIEKPIAFLYTINMYLEIEILNTILL
jgi:hypothetical protein